MVQFTDEDFTDYTDLQMTDHRWVEYRCWNTDAGLQMLDRPYGGQICLRRMIAVVIDVQKLDNR